jgi:predicted nucleic acid-binding protein
LRYDSGLSAALQFRDTLVRARAAKRLRVIWIDDAAEAEGWRILAKFADVRLSLTDATTAAAARVIHVRHVFGFDVDFQALGLTVVPGRPARVPRPRRG